MVEEMMVLAGSFNIGDFIPVLGLFDLQGIVGKMKKLHSRFDSFLNTILEEHKFVNNQHRTLSKDVDFLSTLIRLRDNGADMDGEEGKLTDTEIKALFLVAGTDTSSTAVEWAFAELLRNPKILNQAQQELDLVVGPNRLVTESDLTQLPFLQAIVKETFRLHPSTPLSLPRMAAQSCEINGYFIPKGATLLVNVWAIARDPNVWTNPLEFNPHRFLPGGEKPNVDIKRNDFEMIPFGGGRRICSGMRLGIRMVHLLVATLVHAFDWDLGNGQSVETLNMEEAYGLTLQRAVPLMLHSKPRIRGIT
nr:flavonoid 3'-hydroxylase [Ipomoea batatas]